MLACDVFLLLSLSTILISHPGWVRDMNTGLLAGSSPCVPGEEALLQMQWRGLDGLRSEMRRAAHEESS